MLEQEHEHLQNVKFWHLTPMYDVFVSNAANFAMMTVNIFLYYQ